MGEQVKLDTMDLPKCLERVDGGIRVTGHRVSLACIAREFLHGALVSRLWKMYPTIESPLLDQVLAFCNENIREVRSYVGREDRAAERLRIEIEAKNQKPTVAELQMRQIGSLTADLTAARADRDRLAAEVERLTKERDAVEIRASRAEREIEVLLEAAQTSLEFVRDTAKTDARRLEAKGTSDG